MHLRLYKTICVRWIHANGRDDCSTRLAPYLQFIRTGLPYGAVARRVHIVHFDLLPANTINKQLHIILRLTWRVLVNNNYAAINWANIPAQPKKKEKRVNRFNPNSVNETHSQQEKSNRQLLGVHGFNRCTTSNRTYASWCVTFDCM